MLDPLCDRLVDLALLEDLALGDVTSEATVDPRADGVGRIAAKATLVVAGIALAQRVFERVDPAIQVAWDVADGEAVAAGAVLGMARGPIRSLLAAERAALNFLQHLCGVATLTRRYVDAVAGTQARIVDTRKTTPGWRVPEKAAVRAGGGDNHRLSLGAGVLIKDNHVDAGAGVAGAVQRARAHAPHSLRVEVEVRDLVEVDAALAAGADIVLLDNMALDVMREAARRARLAGALSEASGGVTLETVRGVAEAGVDLISVGALTHSAPAVDIHMKLV